MGVVGVLYLFFIFFDGMSAMYTLQVSRYECGKIT